jgi:FtsH-binding integral membrane protein
MVVLSKKNIIRNIILVVGIIFVILSTILLLNDLELGTITQWTVMSSYFTIIFMIIGIVLRITQK